ncbi:MAG: hypothetical protein P8X86_19485 [Desulfofustis sp.]|jgi:uncharacterized membrane protein YbaN (DUF454 family)
MTNGQNHTDHKLGARIAIIVATVSFSLYVVNMLIGKANIVYGKQMFHIGDIGEFLMMLAASIAFIVAALFQEADYKANLETNNN